MRPPDSDHSILVVPDSLDYANGILKGAGNKASPFFQPTKNESTKNTNSCLCGVKLYRVMQSSCTILKETSEEIIWRVQILKSHFSQNKARLWYQLLNRMQYSLIIIIDPHTYRIIVVESSTFTVYSKYCKNLQVSKTILHCTKLFLG